MKTNLRRTVIALTTACALLIVAAAPASASSYDAEVTGGTILITKTGQPDRIIPMTPDPTSGCPTGGLYVTTTNTSTTPSSTSGSVNATLTSTGKFFFGGTTAADHFIAVITGGSTVTGGSAGTWNHSGTSTGTISSLTLRLTVRLYSGGSTSCTPVATNLRCTWTVTLHLSGTYVTGDIRHPAVSDTLHFTGASTAALALGGACAAPFSTYTGGNVTVSSLGVHITNHRTT